MIDVSAPSLEQNDSYTPGLPREYVAKKYGVALDDVANLGSAENPFGASPRAAEAVGRAMANLSIYPEWTARLMREAIGKKYEFDADCVACGAVISPSDQGPGAAFQDRSDAARDQLEIGLPPGTGTPEVGGLSYEQARRIMELVFERNEVVGFDLVEVNPSYDPTQITGLLSAQLLVDAIGLRYYR